VVPETFTVIVVLWKARKRNHVAATAVTEPEDALQANGDLGHRLGRGRVSASADLLTDREVTDDAAVEPSK